MKSLLGIIAVVLAISVISFVVLWAPIYIYPKLIGFSPSEQVANWSQESSVYLATWMATLTFLGLIGLALTVFETIQGAKAAHQLLMLERTPYLTLKPRDGMSATLRDGEITEEAALCFIENTGRGGAVVTAIYRDWVKWPAQAAPPPFDPDNLGPNRTKTPYSLSIGGESRSDNMNSFALDKTSMAVTADEWVYFMGFVEYRDIAKQQSFVSGFCYVLRGDQPKLGLHVAGPQPQSDKYWYNTKTS
tara:strand:+ start:2473 stop:3213 length:741 start_codon:yes stop_codon:yes gene_type:complete